MLKSLNDSVNFAYADDTAIIVADKNIQNATKLMQQQLDIAAQWCHDNGLVINANKTKLMHIKPRHLIDTPIVIKFHDTSCLHKRAQNLYSLGNPETCTTNIELVKTYKYLGVYVDNCFKWKPQINEIRKKLRKASYVLYHLSNCATYSVLRQAYFSLAESYIRHGISAWGSAKYSKTLQKTQDQILKILWKNHNNSRNTSTCTNININTRITNNTNINSIRSFPKELNILNVNRIYSTSLASDFFDDSRFLHPIDHGYNTRRRSQKRFKVERFYNEYGKSTLPVMLPTIINKLPITILNTTNVMKRKKLIKQFFISSQ
ncbi:uncharacterized protein LOC119615183 [Lucilia sericata]|uniref:uncharacterized protein LOC119615183 n=1 Tax=Lucilia sericata TaxID=13632 RepID=UPI0018A85B7A|nr:uncharacterized protein LOC119615183 [Lucilia sericata]